MKENKKFDWREIMESEVFASRFRLFLLFVLGVLLGVSFKTQALRTIARGYDDHRILKSDSIQERVVLEASEETAEVELEIIN